LNYEDFVWFCLSEEDKTSNVSIEYCFRLLDYDFDGVLSIYELEVFYMKQIDKMNEMFDGNESIVAFDDILFLMFFFFIIF
jgi:serine/threonine-protein phosphatase 2A regulatory subunit B''